MNKALFLDRDGTLIEHKPYLYKPEEVILLPGVIAALRNAREAGYLLFLFTNQSGVGRGYFKLEDVHRVHARLIESIGLGSDIFKEICVAVEHPDTPSIYRKPSPRFILEMIAKYDIDPKPSWMIGDSPSDWQAGLRAGISAAAVRSDLTKADFFSEAQNCSIAVHDNLISFIQSVFTP
jgi:D-glycero-D-manno-heptose 1,7-bisphosphate phosphatase